MLILISPILAEAVPMWMEHATLAAAVVVAVVAVIQVTRKKERRKIEPDPLRVRKVTEKASEENCKERHLSCMEAIETIARENADEHKRLYDQIDVVERRAEDSLKSSMAAINETFRKLPGEVIKLLRDTGQLKDHHHHGRPDK
jgi:hypothetical protein